MKRRTIAAAATYSMYAYLNSQKGVDRSRVVAGGASCGFTQSSELDTRHHEIKASTGAIPVEVE